MKHEEDYKIEIQIKSIIDKVLDEDTSMENTISTLTLNESQGNFQGIRRSNGRNMTVSNMTALNQDNLNDNNIHNGNIIKQSNIENYKRGSLFIPQSDQIYNREFGFQEINNFYEQQKNFRHSNFNSTFDPNNWNWVNLNQNNENSRRGSNASFISVNENDYYELVLNFSDLNEENYSILSGKIAKLLTNQKLSRVLQNCITKTNDSIHERILTEISPSIPDLMCNSYANYFIRHFFKVLSSQKRIYFLKCIGINIRSIALNKIGTYPLQFILESLRSKEEKFLVIEIFRNHNFLVDLCLDPNCVHVIEKFMNCADEELIPDFYDIILKRFPVIVNDQNGVAIAKRVIILSKNREYKEKIQKFLYLNAVSLIESSFGNYVIQTAVETWEPIFFLPIVEQLYGNFFKLSLERCCSNVIEKCLERGGESVVTKYIEEVCYSNKLFELMKSNYGNYVVQTALRLSSGSNRDLLVKCLIKNTEKVGHKLYGKWRSIVAQFCENKNNNVQRKSFLNHNKLLINQPVEQARKLSVFYNNHFDIAQIMNYEKQFTNFQNKNEMN